MITFALAFLGLVLGVQEIELLVEGEVAAVRLLLDGRLIGELTEEPWKLSCDFGQRLQPHLLEAVAVDRRGREIDRIRQPINLPRERAAAALLLEGEQPNRPQSARLVWQHIEYPSAETISFRFDGRELPTDAPDRVQLPAHDPESLHVVEAELAFVDGAHYRAELNLGGRIAFGADAELTGVTIVWSKRSHPELRALEGRFRLGKRTLPVVGIEKAPSKVVMVVDRTAIPALRELATFGTTLTTPETDLRAGEQLIFLFPEVKRVEDLAVPARLFAKSQAFSAGDGSIPWILSRVTPPGEEASPHRRITDALAVAGVEAAAGHRPRAVVLVMGTELEDASVYEIDEVRDFLRLLQVPLLVWWTGQPLSKTVSEDRRPLTLRTPWGLADDISTPTRIVQATGQLRQQLEQQLTVWIEGSHLPQHIDLARGTRGFRLAG